MKISDNIVYNSLGRGGCFLFRLARPSQVSLSENLIGESAIKTEDEIGTQVQYAFRVRSQMLLP